MDAMDRLGEANPTKEFRAHLYETATGDTKRAESLLREMRDREIEEALDARTRRGY